MSAQTVEISGRLHGVWEDPRPGEGEPRLHFYLADDAGRTTALRLGQGDPYTMKRLMRLQTERIAVRGSILSGEANPSGPDALEVSGVTEIGSETGYSLEASTALVQGSQPWVTVLCRFRDDSSVPHSIQWYEAVTGASYPGIDDFWQEVSFGRIDLSGSRVVGWYELPEPRSAYMDGDVPNLTKLKLDCAGAADADVYFPDFAGINFQFSASIGCCSWGGNTGLEIDGVPKAYRGTWMADWADLKIYAHESGHGFGLPHSSGPYGQTYDSDWDVMSRGRGTSHPSYGWIPPHTLAAQKDRAGWIDPGARYEVKPGSSQTIEVAQLATTAPSGTYHLVWIPLSDGSIYTVEARRFHGYDEVPGEAILLNHIPVDKGLQVVDADNDGNPNDDGAIWRPGETFTDPSADLEIRILEETSTGFLVSVSLGGEASDPVPMIALTPTSLSYETTSEAGPSSQNFTVTNSGDETLNYNVSVNRSWLSLSQTSGSLAPNASHSVSLSLDANGLSAGDYAGTVTVNGNADNAPQTVPVALTVTEQPAAPLIALTPTSLAYETTEGTNPLAKSFTVKNDGGGTLDYTVSSNRNWLNLSRTAGSLAAGASQNVSVSVDASSLSVGTQSGTLTVGGNGENASETVSVTVVVNEQPAAPLIALTPTSLAYETTEGTNPLAKSFTVKNDGGGTLDYTVSSNRNWLGLSRTSGSLAAGASHEVSVSVDASSRPVGTSNGTLTVGGNGENAPETVAVSLTVTEQPSEPRIAIGPSSLDFQIKGKSAPGPKKLGLQNSGSQDLNWNANSNQPWLKLGKTSGTLSSGSTDSLSVEVSLDGLEPGTYDATIEVAGNADNSPQSVAVQLKLTRGGVVKLKKGRLTFAGSTEEEPLAAYVLLENDGDATAEWSASTDQEWVELETSSGRLVAGETTGLALRVDITSLSPGHHSASIEFAGGDDELPDTLRVELMVSDGPGVRHGPEQVAAHLLGAGASLGSDELDYIDLVGNGNGRFDIGDLRAWLIQAGELAADAPVLNLRPGYTSQPDSTSEGLPAVGRESAERRD